MDTSTFETVAEIAVGLVGFSGIVLALRPRVDANPIDRARFVDLLVAGFGVVFLSFLPGLLDSLFSDSATAWRFASAAQAAWFALAILSAVRRFEGPVPVINAVGVVIGAAFAVALAIVASGPWVHYAYSVYFAALLWGLFVAAMEFSLLLLAGQEDASSDGS